MLDWLKKLGGGKPWQNKAGLEERDISLLAEDSEVLEKFDSDLPTEVLRYVLDGEGDALPGRLGTTPGVGEALEMVRFLPGQGKRKTNARAGFFESIRHAPPDFFVRLGKIYEAAVRSPATNPTHLAIQRSALPQQPGFGDVRLSWLDILLTTATRLSLNSWPRKSQRCPALSAATIEAMLEGEGFSGKLLIGAAFEPNLQRFFGAPLEVVFVQLEGSAESAVRHRDRLLEVLNHPDFKQRIYALDMMKKCQVPLEPFIEKLVELGIGSSKQVRERAWILLIEKKDAARPMIEERIRNGENEERDQAVQLLWRWEGEKARAFLEAHLASEKNKKVAQTIRELVEATAPDQSAKIGVETLNLPPLPEIPKRLALGPETEKAWHDCFNEVNQRISHFLTTNRNPNHYGTRNLKPFSNAAIRQAFEELAEGQGSPILNNLPPVLCIKEACAPLKAFWRRTELQQVHLVRFLIQTGGLKPDSEQNDRYSLFGYWLESLVTPYHRAHPDLGLRELAAAFTAAGLNPARIGQGLLQRFGSATPYGMSRNQVWPYRLEHLDLLEEAFAPAGSDFMARFHQRQARAHAFEVMACFPQPPQRLLPLLWSLALGPKSERPEAQRCLASIPDKAGHLGQTLAAGNAEARLAAAEWLSRLGDKKSH